MEGHGPKGMAFLFFFRGSADGWNAGQALSPDSDSRMSE
jgi:hypothetical protein